MLSVDDIVQGESEAMTYDEIILEVSDKLGLAKGLVDRTYRAYWRSVREHIASLPLKEDLTDEEFMKLQPNVNIPSIGKLNVTLDRYHRMKKSFEYYKHYKLDKEKKDVTHKDDQASV